MNRRKRMMESLDQDIRDYIERETRDNIERGMPPEEARHAALRKFGNATRVREDAWEVWSFVWFEQLWQDVHFGLRMLAKNPGFAVVAALTLAFGIGANAAIFSLIDAVILRALPVDKPGELLQVKRHDPRWAGEPSMYFTNPLWEQVRDHQDVFSGIFAWGNDRFDLAQGGAVHLANGIWVSGSFFSTLGLRPAAGRLLARADDRSGCPAVAALSYGFWQDLRRSGERCRRHRFAQQPRLSSNRCRSPRLLRHGRGREVRRGGAGLRRRYLRRQPIAA